jgi:hypothetical protein
VQQQVRDEEARHAAKKRELNARLARRDQSFATAVGAARLIKGWSTWTDDRGSHQDDTCWCGDAVMDKQTKNEVLATYTAFLAAFRANDVQAIDKLFQYPFAYIGNGQTNLLDTFPIKPAELMAAKQWHDTKDFSYEVVFASADKAHLIVRQATRVRADRFANRDRLRLLRSDPHTIRMEVLRPVRHHHPGLTGLAIPTIARSRWLFQNRLLG